MTETLRSLGESELIQRLSQFAPAGQLDDDTATLPRSGQHQVINTDLLVEGVHFSDTTTSAEDVGWRAAAVNLSDLAASGADTVVGLTVGLVAPGATAWTWVYGGLGVAALVGSATWFGVSARRQKQKRETRVSIGPTGVMVSGKF